VSTPVQNHALRYPHFARVQRATSSTSIFSLLYLILYFSGGNFLRAIAVVATVDWYCVF